MDKIPGKWIVKKGSSLLAALFPFQVPSQNGLSIKKKKKETKVDAVQWVQESCDGGPSLNE